jgi:hypothetical protein
MDKARRHELKMLKYKRRLKLIGFLNDETLRNPKGETYNLTSYRNHSKPCSCYMCSPNKYSRPKVKSDLPKVIDFGLNYDMGELEFDFYKGIYVEKIEDENAHLLAMELIQEY